MWQKWKQKRSATPIVKNLTGYKPTENNPISEELE